MKAPPYPSSSRPKPRDLQCARTSQIFPTKPQNPNPKPQTDVSSRLSRPAVGLERTRISCHAALDKFACAPFRKEGHEVRQRYQGQQEIRGSEVEGPAVPSIPITNVE